MAKKENKIITTEYKQWLTQLKQNFRKLQIKASIQVNSTLLEFYWKLGNEIVEKQEMYKWGSGFLKQLSHDLSDDFPDIKGFSLSNLQYIRRWVLFYLNSGTSCSTNEIIKMEQVVPQLFLVPFHKSAKVIYE